MTRRDEKICFACGTCTAGCPVRDVEPSFDPRRIVRRVALDLVDDDLLKTEVWLCADCHTCSERCPQKVPVNEIVMALRNLAVRRGLVHPSYRAQVETIRKAGRVYEVEDWNKKREKSGLPTLRDDGSAARQVLESLGVTLEAGEGEEPK